MKNTSNILKNIVPVYILYTIIDNKREMSEVLNEIKSNFAKVNDSYIYSEIGKLTNKEFIESFFDIKEDLPKKYIKITDKGKERFYSLKEDLNVIFLVLEKIQTKISI